MTNLNPGFGLRLRAVRQGTGATMGGLAGAADCSYRHLQMIETTDRRPSPELLVRLLRELSRLAGREVTVDELNARNVSQPSEPADVRVPA